MLVAEDEKGEYFEIKGRDILSSLREHGFVPKYGSSLYIRQP